MDIIPDKRKLVGLVEQSDQGKICLPDFQRDFVWPREQVADLIRSVLRKYFIGSLLLLRCDPQDPPFAPVYLRGANPPLRDPHPELLVLDGQQRLTALVYSLTAPDTTLKDSSLRRWFFVDLKLLIEEPDSDAIVFDRSRRDLDGLDRREIQYERSILPCTCLLDSSSFLNWRDGLDDWLRANDPVGHDEFRAKWRDAWTKAITDFQTFEIPLVELPRVSDSEPESIGRVCAIFEKLNSTGVDLSIYDLLTARLYRSGVRLHDLWEDACKANPLLKAWSDGSADVHKFGVLVLRVLALLRGIDPKPGNLIDLKPAGFPHDWQRAAGAMERALQLVTLVGQDGLGVFDQKWLPGFGLLPVLAALREEIEIRRLGEGPRSDLRRWYWCNVFLERYSSAVESKSRKDYSELLARWTSAGPEPAVFSEARAIIGADTFSVQESASFASSVYSGVFCLLAINGARDWRRGENIQLQDLQDHHIFPSGYLRRHGFEKKPELNTILNRTLISDETNNKIKDKPPADYLSSTDIFPSGPSQRLLSPHFIDKRSYDQLMAGTGTLTDSEASMVYEKFLRAREAAIVSKIREMCGTPMQPATSAP